MSIELGGIQSEARVRPVSVAGLIVAWILGCGSAEVPADTDASSSTTDAPGTTGADCSPPKAALVVSIEDEAGNPVNPPVSYSVDGGPFTPASCPSPGVCQIADGYGAPITVRVQGPACDYELSANGAPDFCGPSPMLAFTVYANCTGAMDTGMYETGEAESTSGESTSGESTSGESTSGESTSGESTAGESSSSG